MISSNYLIINQQRDGILLYTVLLKTYITIYVCINMEFLKIISCFATKCRNYDCLKLLSNIS